MKRYIIIILLLSGILGFGQNNPIFSGGNGDGWAYADYQMPSNNIYSGGSGDGWSTAGYAQENNNIYNGGMGDGWATLATAPFTLEIQENEFGADLVAYPNPTQGTVTVKLGTVYSKTEIQIFNTLGQEIKAQIFTNTDTLILDVGSENGVYFLSVKDDGKTATLKVIKK